MLSTNRSGSKQSEKGDNRNSDQNRRDRVFWGWLAIGPKRICVSSTKIGKMGMPILLLWSPSCCRSLLAYVSDSTAQYFQEAGVYFRKKKVYIKTYRSKDEAVSAIKIFKEKMAPFVKGSTSFSAKQEKEALRAAKEAAKQPTEEGSNKREGSADRSEAGKASQIQRVVSFGY